MNRVFVTYTDGSEDVFETPEEGVAFPAPGLIYIKQDGGNHVVLAVQAVKSCRVEVSKLQKATVLPNRGVIERIAQ